MSPTAAVAHDTQAMDVLVAPVVAVEDQDQSHQSSHPMQCAMAQDEQRIRDALHEADAVLDGGAWLWVRELLGAMHDDETVVQCKLFFLRLLRASTSEEMETLLSEMEAWREELLSKMTNKKTRRMALLDREEREGIQALFLLGVDKQMSLNRCA